MAKANQLEMLSARRPHCFYVFSSNLSSERLKIPVKFIRHMEGRTSGSVSLTGPSGNTWHVDLIQQNDGLFFNRGWPEFVRDHLIECGDFLVFRYDRELHFTVQVFDKSACEKEAAFYSKCNQEHVKFDKNVGQKREREEVATCSDKISEGVSKKIRESSSDFHPDCLDKNQKADKEKCGNEELTITKACQEETSSKEKKHCGSPPKIFSVPSRSKAHDENQELTIKRRTSKEDNLNLHDGGCISMLSDPEEKKVAQSFTSSFPYFLRTMKRFNVSGSYTLNVPYQFSMEHLPKCKTEIVLRNVKGVCWTVNSVPTTRVHTSHTFCGGWLAFVRSNEIKMGDICIFELVQKSEMHVHIFRVGKAACNGLNIVPTSTSQKISEGLPKKLIKNSPKVHSKSLNNIQICDKKGSKTHEKGKHGDATKSSAKHSRIGNKKPEPGISSLRVMVALDEQKVAQSFTSGFPNFVRIMKKFNISGSYTLKIPYQFSIAHLPDCKTEIVLRNLQGECWTVNSVPDSKGRMVHTFCGGWMAFVRGNDIKMGDICIFELISKWEMRVHISGLGRKGMDHQHGKSGSNEMSVGSAIGNRPPF